MVPSTEEWNRQIWHERNHECCFEWIKFKMHITYKISMSRKQSVEQLWNLGIEKLELELRCWEWSVYGWHAEVWAHVRSVRETGDELKYSKDQQINDWAKYPFWMPRIGPPIHASERFNGQLGPECLMAECLLVLLFSDYPECFRYLKHHMFFIVLNSFPFIQWMHCSLLWSIF